MDHRLEIVRGAILILSLILLAGAILVRWFQRTKESPSDLTGRLAITFLLLSFTFASAVYLRGGNAFIIWPFIAVFCGVVFSLLWTPSIGSWFAGLFTGELDGGNEPPEPKPFYSIARGLRAKGQYEVAIAEVEKQLQNFPNDFEGQLLLAEIQAANLNDIAAAEAAVETICQVPKQTRQHIAAALNTLADWHLKFAKDHEAARRDLERVIELCPDSEAALGAAQRIAHLGAEEAPWSLREHKKVFVPEGIKNYGLMANPPSLTPKEISPEILAAEYVRHLEEHPLDMETREQLALVYANHYQRLDMAKEQLEQLIAQPNITARKVAHWLNLLADRKRHP